MVDHERVYLKKVELAANDLVLGNYRSIKDNLTAMASDKGGLINIEDIEEFFSGLIAACERRKENAIEFVNK